MDTDDVEQVLGAAYDAGDADTGLYNTGLKFVVFDIVDGKKTFQWFDNAMDFSDVHHG